MRSGSGCSPGDDYQLNRLQAHVDLRLRDHFEAFVQLEDVTAPGLARPGPADRNAGDLRQAFVAWRDQLGPVRYTVQIGRQEVAFDLERFVSIREGPNVRQAFDAVWLEAEDGRWGLQALGSHPVQYRPGAFDDVSNGRLAFDAVRVERRQVGVGALSAYIGRYLADRPGPGGFLQRDRRDVFDARYFKPAGRLQYDLEVMRQTGRMGARPIEAWAVGARGRYLASEAGWKPKLGLQLDLGSGGGDPASARAGTFNPLFSHGLYFTQADYTTYANLIHLKPTLTLDPTPSVTLLAGIGVQWRQRTSDAVYVQPAIPLPGTAGLPGRYTGSYVQGRADWRVTPKVWASVEAVRFDVAEAIRRAGGRNADYAALDLAFAWWRAPPRSSLFVVRCGVFAGVRRTSCFWSGAGVRSWRATVSGRGCVSCCQRASSAFGDRVKTRTRAIVRMLAGPSALKELGQRHRSEAGGQVCWPGCQMREEPALKLSHR